MPTEDQANPEGAVQKEEGQTPKAAGAQPAPKAGEAKAPAGKPQAPKGAPAAEAPATTKPSTLETKYAELQKAHQELVNRFKTMSETGGSMGEVLRRLEGLERKQDMRDAEGVMARVQNYTDLGRDDEARQLATREVARRASALGLTVDSPELAHLKVLDPVQALHVFLVQEPTFMGKGPALQPAAPPAGDTAPPSKPNGNNSQPAGEERIGGKTKAELEVEFAKKHGLFKGLPDAPAGQTHLGYGNGDPATLLRQGLMKLHADEG